MKDINGKLIDFPEKWYVKVDENNVVVLSEWLWNDGDLLPLGHIVGMSERDGRFEKGFNEAKDIKGDYYDFGEKITFNQFRKYILNESIDIFDEVEEKEDLSYLNKLFKKLKIK